MKCLSILKEIKKIVLYSFYLTHFQCITLNLIYYTKYKETWNISLGCLLYEAILYEKETIFREAYIN